MLRRSLGARLALAYLGPTLLGLFGLGFYVDLSARRALEEELGRKVVAVASAAAASLPAERLVVLQPGDEETRTYARYRDRLDELQAATGVRRLTVFTADERALVDAGGGARIGDLLPELARDRLELAQVFRGVAQPSQVMFEAEGRAYKTGYAPVLAGDEIVAAVLVEGSAEYFAALRDFRASLLLLGLLATAGAVVVALAASRTLTQPIRRLVDAARRIGGGDLATEVPGKGQDELGYLAGTLDEMRERLLARDRQMQMMLAGIAHEVRNPLGGMELYSGLLLEELEGDEAKLAQVRTIRREIEQLGRIVNDFLDYARERPVALSEASARVLLEEAAGLVAGQARDRQVRIEVEGEAALLSCDVALVKRALLNLVQNALQASPPGTVVHLRSAAAGAGRVALSVADEGKGVLPGDAARIFEPFFTTKEKGTGLGLAFVKKIAEAHRGSIALVPTPGGGATFVLELPAARAATPSATAAG